AGVGSKVKAESGGRAVLGLKWLGNWENCKGSSRSRDRLLADPVDVQFRNTVTGSTSRYNLVQINSRVWDTQTRWAPVFPGGRDSIFTDSYTLPRVLQNTARRML